MAISASNPNAKKSITLISGLVLMGLWSLALAGTALSLNNRPDPTKPVVEKTNPNATFLLAEAEGTIKALGAKEGDEVPEGVEIVFLNDEEELAAMETAQAHLQEVASKLRNMDVATVEPIQAPIGGAFISVPCVIPSVNPGTFAQTPPPQRGSIPELPGVSGTPIQQTESPTATTTKPNKELEEKVLEARTKLEDLNAMRDNYRMALEEVQKNIGPAEIAAKQTQDEADKQRMLLQQGVVPANKVSMAESQALQAKILLEQYKKQSAEAKSQLETVEMQIEAVKVELSVAEKALKDAPTVVVSTPNSNSNKSTAQLPIPERSGATSSAPRVVFKPSEPPPIPAKVDVDLSAIQEGSEDINQAKAKVDEAEAKLLMRRIRAPKGMKIVRLLVKPGDKIRKGQPIAEFVPVPELDKFEPILGPFWNFVEDK
jgi:multidrug resistance efflux pump